MESGKLNKPKKRTLLTVFALIGVSIILLYLGRPFFFGGSVVEKIASLDLGSIDYIVIEPPKHVKTEKSLLSRRIEIREVGALTNINNALNKATQWKPIHPVTVWKCVFSIYTKDEVLTFLAKKTKNNGLLIQVKSKGEWGWNLGTLRSDDLGELLEKIAQ
jgi:hypothetical protein